MASNLERRFDIARSALGRRAQEQSIAEQDAMRQKFASQGSLESGAAIKGAVSAEEALARKASQAGTDIGRAESQAALALESSKAGREFTTQEAISGRDYAKGEAAAAREFAGGQVDKGREFQASESALSRALEQRKITIAEKELVLNEQITLSNLRRQQEEANKPAEPATIDKLISGQMGTELIERAIGRPLTEGEKKLLPHHRVFGTDLSGKSYKDLDWWKAARKSPELIGDPTGVLTAGINRIFNR